ncbi:MAG: hypothetical protein ACLRWQ_20250 [Flavonifractor plautii]
MWRSCGPACIESGGADGHVRCWASFPCWTWTWTRRTASSERLTEDRPVAGQARRGGDPSAPNISNFTDFNCTGADGQGVHVRYVSNPRRTGQAGPDFSARHQEHAWTI